MATSPMSPHALVAEPGRFHLILVGLPGSGKSAVGGLVARAMGRGFLDFDREISSREKMSIAEIFAKRGEAHFRELEHQLTEELRQVEGMVLAPGGGWVGRADTVALLRPPAQLIYLRVTPATALRRMGRGVAKRPLLRHADPCGELDRLLAKRRESYESADLVIDVERIAAQEVSRRIVEVYGAVNRGNSADRGTPG